MQLENLYISGSFGKLTGHITFKNELGQIKLELDEKFSQEIIQVCGAALVRISEKAASEMSAKVIDAIMPKQIESSK